MSMVYADVDQGNNGACKSVIMHFEFDTQFLSDPKAVAILNLNGGPFQFQFPPRISTDSKSARWKTLAANAGAYDDIVMWQGADSRSLTLEATYVIDGNQWTADRISKLAHAAKAYLYLSLAGRLKNPFAAPCVIIESLYGAVQQRSSWRMESASIAYGEHIVGPFQSSPQFHPLTTKITFSLKSWVNLKMSDEAGKEKDTVSDFKNIETDTSALWY
jgi:hypothetical protein